MSLDPRPSNLNRLVDYQSDSIVSKVLLKSASGTVTLFALAGGQELSEHSAPFDAMIQVTEGSARIGVLGELHKLSAGEVIGLPAGKPHSVQADGPFKMILTMLRT